MIKNNYGFTPIRNGGLFAMKTYPVCLEKQETTTKKLHYKNFLFWKIPIGWKKLSPAFVSDPIDDKRYAFHSRKLSNGMKLSCETQANFGYDLIFKLSFVYCPDCMEIIEYFDNKTKD